ncbi:hypothetical protein DPMN_029937 [Dreissena polymorpha]|uniref:Uncharacterized protein n=1 Tax=Dreissena polymorpha TaxID=45954 RepID=A0A9D4LZY6_DREPO|nr:hypothetical protein DPMN_029937 [Dreissena polymorpha]
MSQRSLLDFGLSVSSNKQKNDEDHSQNVQTLPCKKLTSETKVRAFQTVWCKKFEFNGESKKMFCKVCHAANKQNSFTKEGAGM